MTNSTGQRVSAAEKLRRLTDATVRVFHEQGVERTTLADIARDADVPLGNVYYYFKTKDALIQAAVAAHGAYQDALLARLAEQADPRARLAGLVEDWIDQREQAARRGCPTATLAIELGKRGDHDSLAAEATAIFRRLLDWIADQFKAIGADDPDGSALSLLSRYEGMAVLAHVLRDATVILEEGGRLLSWLDSVGRPPADSGE
ncbi:DNA-binding transcriptional regulator, AcrR family [Actinoplanes philippinensis]|uniref:DNA-binding transcriptional regulator, AcrR family n=1 Tax=Actinoplanes philippinensis TaxID=35752 RepID=A0A1I2KAK1_9ACTN|nr:DNA-binding transcriptional regulator, AcrR family [Actinoplanes philippinensis]